MGRLTEPIDEKDAMKQAIYLALSTERFEIPIFTWVYGTEKIDLYGQRKEYVIPKLQGRITESLMADDRIQSVTNFKVDNIKGRVYTISCVVSTIFGDIDITSEVDI